MIARTMTQEDVPACTKILNHTVALGGSTAQEEPMTEAEFAHDHLVEALICNVVEAGGRVVGFQGVWPAGEGLYSIGSFTDRSDPIPGAGRVLFDKMLSDCRRRGGKAILAKITSDNVGGLAYYSKMGFADFEIWPNDHERPDGRKVDRIVKRYLL